MPNRSEQKKNQRVVRNGQLEKKIGRENQSRNEKNPSLTANWGKDRRRGSSGETWEFVGKNSTERGWGKQRSCPGSPHRVGAALYDWLTKDEHKKGAGFP